MIRSGLKCSAIRRLNCLICAVVIFMAVRLNYAVSVQHTGSPELGSQELFGSASNG